MDVGSRNRRRAFLLAAILLVAFSLRLAWALVVESGTRQSFTIDANFYDRVARELLQGEGYLWHNGQPTAYFPPGYPLLLAAAYGVFGDSLIVAKLLNVVLGTLTCLLTYAVGRHAYGETVGLLAAALFAVFPGDIYSMSATLSEVPFACLLAGTLFAFLVWSRDPPQPSTWRWLLLGLVLGLASLVRGIALPFLAVFVAAWLPITGFRRETLKRALLAALGLTLVVAPWAIRNHLVMGGPILLSTDGAYVLFNAHSPLADGTQSFALNASREEVFSEYRDLPRAEREVAMSKAQLRYAVRYMLTHPLQELSLVPKRLYHLYRDDHWAFLWLGKLHEDPVSSKRRRQAMSPHWEARWTAIADVYFFVILALATLGFGMALAPSRRRGLVVPLGVVYFNVAHGILFYGIPRFHAPFVPLLSILAALSIAAPLVALRSDSS